MTDTNTLTWRTAILTGVFAAVLVLIAGFVLLAASRLTQPAPILKSAFAAGHLVADEAAQRPLDGLGRVRADCEIAGVTLAIEKTFGRYMFAPQLPRDPDEVLNTCQTVRDLTHNDAGTKVDTRSTKVNPIALRGVSRLALSFIPLQVWQITLAIAALAIGGVTAFFLFRSGQATVVKLAVLSAATLAAAVFASTTLSLGIGALLWPASLAAAFFVSEKTPWRLLAVCGLFGAAAVTFDYASALGLTVLLSLLFGLTVREARPHVRPAGVLIKAVAAYVAAAVTTILVLALAQANARGFGALDTGQFVLERFTDGLLLLGENGAAIVNRTGERVAKLLAAYDGWSGVLFYAGLCTVIFSGWGLRLKGQKGLGLLVLASGVGVLLWGVLAFDRLFSNPLQFASLPVLLFGYILASIVATVVVKPSAPLESAS